MSSLVQDISILRKKSEPVSSAQEATEILEKLRKELKKIPNGIGLAAIQIGIPKQVGLINSGNEEFILINPEVLEKSEEFIYLHEGCLSFPNVFLDTRRYREFTIKNQVIDGDKFREETQYFYYNPPDINGSDLTGIAVQHEIDHFGGKLIQDFNIKAVPIVNDTKKVGRNDPCPCGSKKTNGSSKKYKHCCGA
jgi:peptide deformylase